MSLTSNGIDTEDPGAVPGASTINIRLKERSLWRAVLLPAGCVPI